MTDCHIKALICIKSFGEGLIKAAKLGARRFCYSEDQAARAGRGLRDGGTINRSAIENKKPYEQH